MKQHFSLRRRQVMVTGTVGAGAIAAPAIVMAAHEPVLQQDGGSMVVSGRIVSAADGAALAGAQIEIWQADARGVRAENTREVVTADGDGRYFAVLEGQVQRLHYRVSHRGYTAKVTQLTGAHQRSVTLTRDDTGATRAAFEMSLAPRNALASTPLDYAAL
jgi:hypothetical protein